MRLFSSKKRVAIVGVTATLALMGGGVAYAWFTGSGSGNGSAGVGTVTPNQLVITQVSTVSDLMPDVGNSGQITFRTTNTGSIDEYVGTVTVTIPTYQATGDVVDGSGAQVAGCKAVWFELSNDDGTTWGAGAASTTVAVDKEILAGAYVDNDATQYLRVKMIDSDTNQNACQGKTLRLHYAG